MSRIKLSRILRSSSKEEEKVSISQAIDKACSDGITAVGRFSVTKIRKGLKEMLTLIESDEFSRDKFFSEFNKVYSLVMAPDVRAKGVFHPSQLLDGCARAMYYDLVGEAPTDFALRKFTGTIQRVFDVGTWYHIYMQNILYNIGYLEQAEVPVISKEKFLNGKADGVFKKEVFGEKVVLEIKTMNSWNFSKAIFRPFKKHEFQASLYARELGAKKVLYLYINKDTSELRDFLMPINEEQLALADKKMTSVIEAVKEGVPPKRFCSDKLCDVAITCPFATLCFRE